MSLSAIWWVRRDLRLHDNQALHAALSYASRVTPLFILDETLLNSAYAGAKRIAFLFDTLRDLDRQLRERDSRLIVRRGRPVEVLQQVREEAEAEIIFAEQDFSPYAARRDAAVAEALPLTLVDGLTIRPMDAARKKDGGVYVVFTPFKRTWRDLPPPHRRDLLPAPDAIDTPELASDSIPAEPALPEGVPFRPGREAALERLQRFTDQAIGDYDEGRDYMARDATSGLSPYLRFGVLSAREAAVAAIEARDERSKQAARQGVDTWLDELIWREFYISVLHHFPEVRHVSFRENMREIEWEENDEHLEAWKHGRTGYPIVDAAMRQLSHSGWMHNRARMIVASFLVKDLLLNWQSGETWFMQQLVDGDPAANNGGWQWAAGTGTDAAPYFRIFNPTTQGKKYDPDGEYIRRWVPELAKVPDKYIHEPAKMPRQVQEEAGCIIGKDYPAPIVDHKAARQRTLDRFKAAREAYDDA
jgi:deoxyribodipyrimidine photo-lyase